MPLTLPQLERHLFAAAALKPQRARKEYLSREGFRYLGRSHRLLLVNKQSVPVKLEAGRFKMSRAVVCTGRDEMIRWYTEHATAWLRKRVTRYQGRVGVEPAGVGVQDPGWGSCGKGRRLYFHWRTILLPPRIADYIVVHELVHLRDGHHTPEFWQRVERAMPDFAQRKQWLAEHGGEAVQL